jgi:3-hydroxyisobutyrate dehydrogenase
MGTVVGVVGLGIMGSAIARSLVSAGWQVYGFDTDPDRQSILIGSGIEGTGSAAELVGRADIIITSLPTAESAHVTMTEIAAAASPKVVIEASTLPLEDKLEVKKILTTAGHQALDCPISGTGAQALVKDLVVYASGHSGTIASLMPVFNGFARAVYDMGEYGNGSRMKLVANLLVAIHNVAAAEAMVLASKAGLDLHKVVESICAGAGTSRIFELRAPLMAEDCYEPATMKLSVWQKDLAIISKFADDLASPVPLFSATLPLYAAGMANGQGDQDTASLYAVLQSMARVGREGRRVSPVAV